VSDTDVLSRTQEVTLTLDQQLDIRSLLQRIAGNLETCAESEEYVARRQAQRGLKKLAELRGLLVGLGVSHK